MNYFIFKSATKDSWDRCRDIVVNSASVGTPCLRYYVRQPDGHKDVDQREGGNYSFAAFGYRHKIGGEINYYRRKRNGNYQREIYAYCHDLNLPLGFDFLGIMGGKEYNFEVLDKFEQKKSLVGAAHLHIHSNNLQGSIIVSLNSDGTLRYVEIKNGRRRFHDSLILYKDRIEIKFGAQLTGIKRKGEYKFGVPLWAFSEDISCKLSLELHDVSGLENPSIKTTDYLSHHAKLRFGHPTNPDRFMNRTIGKTIEIIIQPKKYFRFEIESILLDSASLGEASIEYLSYKNNHLCCTLFARNSTANFSFCANAKIFNYWSEKIQVINFEQTHQLSVDLLAEYAEYLYSFFAPLRTTRLENGIVIKSHCSEENY